MDFNPIQDIIQIIASFRQQIKHSDFMIQAESFADIEKAERLGKLAVGFDLEGGIPLCESPAMVELYASLGVRQIHLAYNRNNSLAGGCHDTDMGLTDKGQLIVDAINQNNLFMDVSHTGYRTSMDIFEYSNAPVIISHGNPRFLKDHSRNFKDEQLLACKATGGVVCVNGVSRFLNDANASAQSMVEAVDYLVQLVGYESVGFGLDYIYDSHLDDGPQGLDLAHWWPTEYGYDKASEGFLNTYFAPPERFYEMQLLMQQRGYSGLQIQAICSTNMRELAKKVWK
jgi:membrane dipeptidase